MAPSQEYPPGTVGVIGSDLARYQWFTQSLRGLWLPPKSQVVFANGLWIAKALNVLLEEMRPEDAFFVFGADDHIFAPDLILRLLSHNLPIVMPLCALRRHPYQPSIFHETPDGFKSYGWHELRGKTGVMPIDTGGGPFAVIRREVIEAVGRPFFENMPGSRETPQEDLYTFAKCRRAGFQPYVDLDCRIGHCLPAAVFPEQLDDGQYGVRLWAYETLGMMLPEPPPDAVNTDYHAYT